MVAGVCFHYRKAVAPLKRWLHQGLQRRRRSFHYRKAVAPLKRVGVQQHCGAGYGFHYRKAVAPLKRYRSRSLSHVNYICRRIASIKPLPNASGCLIIMSPDSQIYVTVIMRITASINETTDAGMIAARTIMPC